MKTSLGSQDRVAIVHYDNKDSGGQGTLMLIHLIKLACASSVFLLFTLEKVDSSNTDDMRNIWEEISLVTIYLAVLSVPAVHPGDLDGEQQQQ